MHIYLDNLPYPKNKWNPKRLTFLTIYYLPYPGVYRDLLNIN